MDHLRSVKGLQRHEQDLPAQAVPLNKKSLTLVYYLIS